MLILYYFTVYYFILFIIFFILFLYHIVFITVVSSVLHKIVKITLSMSFLDLLESVPNGMFYSRHLLVSGTKQIETIPNPNRFSLFSSTN